MNINNIYALKYIHLNVQVVSATLVIPKYHTERRFSVIPLDGRRLKIHRLFSEGRNFLSHSDTPTVKLVVSPSRT